MQRPSISIVIEWENARFAELQRSRRMLRALREELSGFGPAKAAPEVYIVFDRLTIDAAVVEQVVREEFNPATAPAAMKIMPTDGLHYYEQKNLGASQGESEIVVFLDCDVVPERGWLGEMIAAFDDPAVSVVGGETYVELVDGWSRAFALFWLFDIRRERTGLVPSKFFHANNVAFPGRPSPNSTTENCRSTGGSASSLGRICCRMASASFASAAPEPHTPIPSA